MYTLGQLRFLIPILLLMTLSAPPPVHGADWPRFRGPGANGVSAESGLLTSWPEGGPAVVWRRPLGEGFSGVTVVGQHLYTMLAEGDDEFVASFRVADGGEIWRRRTGSKFVDQWGNGPRATPTVDSSSGDTATSDTATSDTATSDTATSDTATVYVLSSEGQLHALNAANGEPRWQVDFNTAFGETHRPTAGKVPFWGHCGSPLVEGDLLVVPTGASGGQSLVAFDKTTGEKRWSLFDHPIGQSSPVAMTLGGRRQVVMALAAEVVGVSLEGEVLWRFPWGRFTIALPLQVSANQVFFSSPNDIGAILVEVEPQGKSFSTKEIWRDAKMRNNWQTSVVHRGSIIGYDNATLKSLNGSGEIQWAKRGLGKGTVIVAGDLLVLLSDRGMLTLARWSSENFQELGRMEIMNGPSWTAPSIARGRLYLRNHEELICLDLRG